MANKNVRVSAEATPESANKSEAFFDKHKYAIISAVVVVILLIVGLFLYKSYVSAPRETKASTALSKAQDLFANEDYEAALESFQGVLSDYKGTRAANLAHLYIGLCYANEEKWAEAVQELEKYSPANDAMVSPAAVAALGNAYANTDNIDKAVSTLMKAAVMADKQALSGANYSISPTFLMQAGMLLESQGKNDEALALYKDIKAKYVNAQVVQSKEVDKYIERLEEK